MTRKEELKYILAQIQRDIELNKKRHAKSRGDEFHLIKVYPDHEVEIEWRREVAEA